MVAQHFAIRLQSVQIVLSAVYLICGSLQPLPMLWLSDYCDELFASRYCRVYQFLSNRV